MVLDAKLDGIVLNFHEVDAVGQVVVGGTGVLGEALFDELGQVGVGLDEVVGPVDGQLWWGFAGKACCGVGVGFDKGDVGFDVEYGGAVKQVGAAAMQDGVWGVFDGIQLQ